MVICREARGVREVKEGWDGRAKEIGVEDAGFEAETGEGQREVGCYGGFAYAAFGGGYGDYFGDGFDAALLGEAALEAWD